MEEDLHIRKVTGAGFLPVDNATVSPVAFANMYPEMVGTTEYVAATILEIVASPSASVVFV
jgi:hypothetical protein